MVPFLAVLVRPKANWRTHTVQYEDARGLTHFGEIQKFLVLKGHHVAVITKLVPNGSLVSGITSSSELLNNYSDSGVLVHHMAVTKRSNASFCIPLCRIKRLCIVVSSSSPPDILPGYCTNEKAKQTFFTTPACTYMACSKVFWSSHNPSFICWNTCTCRFPVNLYPCEMNSQFSGNS